MLLVWGFFIVGIPIFLPYHSFAINVVELDNECTFPFIYYGRSYNKCILGSNSYPWCVTNQHDFDQLEGWLDDDFQQIGWKFCSSTSPLKPKICNECEFPFEYDDIEFNGCTTHPYENLDVTNPRLYRTNPPLAWCATNISGGNLVDWEYCSPDCKRDSGANNLS